MKHRLEKLLRKYFTANRRTGLCTYLNREACSAGSEVHELFFEYAMKWPHSIKFMHEGCLRLDAYFLPASIGNNSTYDSSVAYNGDKITNPVRIEFTNFIIRDLARKQKKKFNPIVVDINNLLK